MAAAGSRGNPHRKTRPADSLGPNLGTYYLLLPTCRFPPPIPPLQGEVAAARLVTEGVRLFRDPRELNGCGGGQMASRLTNHRIRSPQRRRQGAAWEPTHDDEPCRESRSW